MVTLIKYDCTSKNEIMLQSIGVFIYVCYTLLTLTNSNVIHFTRIFDTCIDNSIYGYFSMQKNQPLHLLQYFTLYTIETSKFS